jgi:RNA polymerase sigma-70 factor (ECF subfamily)
MTSDDDDAALMAEARAGSRLAFSRLIDRRQQAVRAFLRRVAADREDADDLAQETFVTAWAHLSSWSGQSSVRAWLLGIAWRKARGAGRTLFRRMARDRAWADIGALAPTIQAGPETRLALEGALARLNTQERAAVALCLAEDYSHAEAAEILGLPLGTVKSQVQRGRAKLLEVLEARP